MIRRPKIYLGGAISGRDFDEVLAERACWTEILERIGFDVVDPAADEEIELDENGCADFPKAKAGIEVTPEQTALLDLRQLAECDIAIFLLARAERVSRGCVSEQGFAVGQGIPTAVLRDVGGCHDHGFVNGLADFVTGDETLFVLALSEWAHAFNNGVAPCLT